MDVLSLSRWQFAITTVYHFLFVPLTLGLSVLVAVLQTIYFKTGNEGYKKLTKYFGTLFLINFAMGVATGIVQEFQFGMNWSTYSRFVGDIFGAPLAVEALVAFFLESTFLGLWIFGWDKLPKGVHLAAIWLVAFASNLSAFWILTANSFMQEPSGFVLRNGRAEMVNFFEIIGNGHLWLQFPHVVFAGFTTAAVFVVAISAYNLLKKSPDQEFMKSLKIGAVFGLISLLLVIYIGDQQGKYLIKTQPMKMAAAEALWESRESAPLSVFAIIDEDKKENPVDIGIPNLLSFMSYNNFRHKVEGINQLQKGFEEEFGEGDYTPPVTLTYWSFRLMIYTGGLMLLVFAILVVAMIFKKTDKLHWLLKLSIFMLPLPYIANSTGWIMAEVGRQPWIVYRLLSVKDGVSKAVDGTSLLISLIGFILIYSVLAIVDVYLMKRHVSGQGLEHGEEIENQGGENLWN